MIVVDEFYDNMKTYFEETGNEYNGIITRYLNIMRQLKENGICVGETANELQLFIECAENLQDATTDISAHINEVSGNYISVIDEMNHNRTDKGEFMERNFTDERKNQVRDVIEASLLRWIQLELQVESTSEFVSELELNAVSSFAQNYRDRVVEKLQKGLEILEEKCKDANDIDKSYASNHVADAIKSQYIYITFGRITSA